MQTVYFKSKLGVIKITGDLNGEESIRIDEGTFQKTISIPSYFENCILEIKEYLDGKRKEFTFSMKPKGTEFQTKVWSILTKIPFGKTLSYLEIATIYSNKKAVKAVAPTIGKNPILVAIPCHRVIGSNGILVGFATGLDKKNGFWKTKVSPFKRKFFFKN
ncbi:MAG: methylated-DNA-[protein]-cysteine S-methyltransferase [Candidatus Arcticimaribacter sp.]|jgi:methylated-DNA-[protein]-cysteine S-methyltransferase